MSRPYEAEKRDIVTANILRTQFSQGSHERSEYALTYRQPRISDDFPSFLS
jgi:hypothetical protein